MTVENVRNVIHELRNINLAEYPRQTIMEALSSILKFPLLSTEFHLGNVVYRARPIKKDEEFTSRTDLSYKPKECNKTYQRASTPNRTMFYGEIIPQENIDFEKGSKLLVGACETSNLLREPQKLEDGEQIILFGKWRILSTCRLVTINFSDDVKNITPYTQKSNGEFNNWMSKEYPDDYQQAKIVCDFLAEEFSKYPITEDYDYMISACFTELLMSDNIHGVIYPSIRVEGKGINVAMTPEFVDNHMRLEKVIECKIYKKGKNVFMNNLRMANVDAETQTFKLEEIEIGNSRAPDYAISQMLS